MWWCKTPSLKLPINTSHLICGRPLPATTIYPFQINVVEENIVIEEFKTVLLGCC